VALPEQIEKYYFFIPYKRNPGKVFCVNFGSCCANRTERPCTRSFLGYQEGCWSQELWGCKYILFLSTLTVVVNIPQHMRFEGLTWRLSVWTCGIWSHAVW